MFFCEKLRPTQIQISNLGHFLLFRSKSRHGTLYEIGISALFMIILCSGSDDYKIKANQTKLLSIIILNNIILWDQGAILII